MRHQLGCKPTEPARVLIQSMGIHYNCLHNGEASTECVRRMAVIRCGSAHSLCSTLIAVSAGGRHTRFIVSPTWVSPTRASIVAVSLVTASSGFMPSGSLTLRNGAPNARTTGAEEAMASLQE